MNRRISLLVALALTVTASFIACDNDDDPQPAPVPEVPTDTTSVEPEDTLVVPTFILAEGYTSATHFLPTGDNGYFTDFVQPDDSTAVTVTRQDGLYSITYSSTTWGEATFTNLRATAQVELTDVVVFPEGITTTITMSRGSFGGSGGGEYELTLINGSANFLTGEVELTVSAFMNANHGRYQLEFKTGDKPLVFEP